jgi:hypothetical protein
MEAKLRISHGTLKGETKKKAEQTLMNIFKMGYTIKDFES